MEDKVNEKNKKKRNYYSLIYLVVPLFIVVYSFIICILEYQQHYDEFGLYIPLMHLYMLVFLLIALIIFKVFLGKKIKLLILFPLVIFGTILSSVVFAKAFSYNGLLYPLIDYGGPLHFIRIKDYDFDGVSDVGWYPLQEYRTETFKFSAKDFTGEESRVDSIELNVVAFGKSEDCCSVDLIEEKNMIGIDFSDSIYDFSNITASFEFKKHEDVGIVKFSICDENGKRLKRITTRHNNQYLYEFVIEKDDLNGFEGRIYILYEVIEVQRVSN